MHPRARTRTRPTGESDVIERYFEKGYTYTWNPPQKITTEPNDGAIVSSRINHPPALTYTGLHAGLFSSPTLPSTLGIVPGTVVPHRWLNYIHGRTAYTRSRTTDVLTGFMSGCWICSWHEGGHRRVGHIGTVSFAGRDQPPNTTVKQAFAASPAIALGSHIRGCNPAAAWSTAECMAVAAQTKIVQNMQIMCLVTTNNDFFSILMLETKTPGKWICGGKKQVHAHHRTTIQNALA